MCFVCLRRRLPQFIPIGFLQIQSFGRESADSYNMPIRPYNGEGDGTVYTKNMMSTCAMTTRTNMPSG